MKWAFGVVLPLVSLSALSVALYFLSKQEQINLTLMRQKTEAVLAANRRLRSASGMSLPGFRPSDLERITRTADNFGTPWQMAAAVYSIEQGGDFLEYGIQGISPFVALSYPEPADHQAAEFQHMVAEEMTKYIFSDMQRRAEFISQYAERQNGKPASYSIELQQKVDAYMDLSQPAIEPKIPRREGLRTSLKKVHKIKRRGKR